MSKLKLYKGFEGETLDQILRRVMVNGWIQKEYDKKESNKISAKEYGERFNAQLKEDKKTHSYRKLSKMYGIPPMTLYNWYKKIANESNL